MIAPAGALTIVALVPNASLPRAASARTRNHIPPGYGTQEQCLPFTAASALGLVIPSPIRFGYCPLDQLPQGCRAFRSPLNRPEADGSYAERRVFYVFDEPRCRFAGNAYALESVPTSGPSAVQEPGLSFFDRDDQANFIKLHLPYVWRTPELIDTLFLPLINRTGHRLDVQSGLVETDWYSSPVNLVLGLPPGPVHVEAGTPVAQAIFVPRNMRRPDLEFAVEGDQFSVDTGKNLADWDRGHTADRSLYKKLARSAAGRLEKNWRPADKE